jgi:hypothetical protein
MLDSCVSKVIGRAASQRNTPAEVDSLPDFTPGLTAAAREIWSWMSISLELS